LYRNRYSYFSLFLKSLPRILKTVFFLSIVPILTVAKQVELKAVGDEIAAIQQRMQGEAATAARQIAETAMA
jgi:hypothetical protein